MLPTRHLPRYHENDQPARAMYSPEKNTIRQLFPRSRDGNGLSVLLERRHLRNIFTGTSRDITKPILADEETDLVAFLRMHLDASHEQRGGGYVESKVRESLASVTSVGLLLGIVRLEDSLPIDCRHVHDRRRLPKVMALAAKVHGHRKGAESFFATVKQPTAKRPSQTTAAPSTKALDVAVEAFAPPPTAAGANTLLPSSTAPAEVDCDSDSEGAAAAASPVSSIVEPLAPPPPRRIELINVEDCASLWKLRKYLTPATKRPRMVSSSSLHAPTRAAVEHHNRVMAANSGRNGSRIATNEALRHERFARGASQNGGSGVAAYASDARHPPRKRMRHRYHEAVPDLAPPTGVMTRRQARALQEEEEAKAAAAAAAREATKVASAPASGRGREPAAASTQRPARFPATKSRLPDQQQRAAKSIHHTNSSVTRESLQVVHLIDLDDKREKTYLKSIEKRRTRRRQKVETVDLTNVSSTEPSDSEDLTLL